jgi:hypothetical protein
MKSMLLLTILISTSLFAADTVAVKETSKVETNYNAPIAGKVIEKINAASYTYLKLKTKTEEVWIAVPQLEIALNTEVEMLKPIPMFGFESKTLKRKFDRIFFGMLKSQKEEKAKEMAK